MNALRAVQTAALAGLVLAIAVACRPAATGVYPGYAEGEYLRVAAPIAGSLATLSVKRGDRVGAGAALFALEQENEKAARQEAMARVERAEAQWKNLRKGKRPDELDEARAQLAQAEAALKLSVADLKRQEQLAAQKFISPTRLDEVRAARERDRAHVAQLRAQVRIAQLAGRSDEIAAAAADIKGAREQLAQADWKLAQKTQAAPRGGLVADTLYTQGEWVPAGMPVIALLPNENIKIRFFVAEPQLGALLVGQAVRVNCDGCSAIDAHISYIASQAEYTSPLIYSKENRANLVFLVEARTTAADAQRLHPGQPLEVRLGP